MPAGAAIERTDGTPGQAADVRIFCASPLFHNSIPPGQA